MTNNELLESLVEYIGNVKREIEWGDVVVDVDYLTRWIEEHKND